MKIGVMFGSPETTTGGNALNFIPRASGHTPGLALSRKGDEVIGNQTAVKVVKNKMHPV